MSGQKELKQAIMRLLARREYCEAELVNKYARKYSADDIEAVLAAFIADGYLSDRRYTESFVRHRVGQRYGLQRIAMELKHKGVSADVVDDVLNNVDLDWFALAVEAWKKRFNDFPEKNDRKTFAKQMRYLLQRGFSMDQAIYVLKEYRGENVDYASE